MIVSVALLMWWSHGGRWMQVDAASASGEPAGSLLWLMPAPTDTRTMLERLDVGDVVAVRGSDGAITARRVAGSTPTSVMVDMPAGGRAAQTFPADDVVATVRWTWPGSSWLVAVVPGLVVLGVGALLLQASAALRRRRRAGPSPTAAAAPPTDSLAPCQPSESSLSKAMSAST